MPWHKYLALWFDPCHYFNSFTQKIDHQLKILHWVYLSISWLLLHCICWLVTGSIGNNSWSWHHTHASPGVSTSGMCILLRRACEQVFLGNRPPPHDVWSPWAYPHHGCHGTSGERVSVCPDTKTHPLSEAYCNNLVYLPFHVEAIDLVHQVDNR